MTDEGWPSAGEPQVRGSPPAEWDARTVDPTGGHVLQSAAWARHRQRTGWEPRFVLLPGGPGVLVLLRRWPLIGGFSAYVPRGPVPLGEAGAYAEDLAHLLRIIEEWGDVDVVALDPELPAGGEAAARMRALGFAPIAEIQPSRHRMSLPLGPGTDLEQVFAGFSKSTRQRIRQAEKDSVAVVRHDAPSVIAHGQAGIDFAPPTEAAEDALGRFYGLLRETGERRQFRFGGRGEFVTWWRAALAAGHLVYLEARAGRGSGDVLAGLVLYRHGRRLSTVHSGDHEASRRTHPGALHLLRWRAIQLAIAEQCGEMDLGGVDVAGARRVPHEGEPMYGLYQHKLSFGARWVELAGAHERAIHPTRYRLGRLTAQLVRSVRR